MTELLPMREQIARIIDPVAAYPCASDGPITVRRREAAFVKADAILALIAAPASPEGWVMVPREPDQGMKDAGWDVLTRYSMSAADVYRAMIAAAPGVVGNEDNSSVAGLPAHVADATATDTHNHSVEED